MSCGSWASFDASDLNSDRLDPSGPPGGSRVRPWAERTRTCRCHFHDVYCSSWAKGLRPPQCSLKPKRIRPVFQWLTENDVCEFESSQPGHAISLKSFVGTAEQRHPRGH